MGRGKKAYGTYGEQETKKGKIIWNLNKEYRKLKKKKEKKKENGKKDATMKEKVLCPCDLFQ